MSINKVILVGNLGADPDMRYMANGGAVANISIATSLNWKDKQSGERRDSTEWHRVVFFNRLAEVVGEYLRKGSQVYVEGRLQTRKWQDKSGQDRWTTEIIATEMTMLGSRTGGTADFNQQNQSEYPEPNQSTTQAPQQTAPVANKPTPQAPTKPVQQPQTTPQNNNVNQAPPAPTYEDFDDDIPF